MRRKRIIIILLFISAFADAYALEIPGLSAHKTPPKSAVSGQNATYDEMQKMQEQDFDKLRSEYDARARRECPRTPEGSIDTNSKQYKKLAGEYSKSYKDIREKYVQHHPAKDSLSKQNAIDGVKNTGSDLRDIRSDVDWSADTPEAAQKKVDQWTNKKQKVVEYDYKVVNTETGEVLWKPGYDNDPRKIADPDAFGTTGGRQSVGAGGVADPKGATIDHEKKFTAGESTGNIKEQSKAVSKSGKETGRAQAPENKDLYQKAKSQQRYGDEISSGVTNLGDDPEVQNKKRQQYQNELKQELEQNKVEAAKQSDVKQNAREKIAESAKKAETAGDNKWNEAKNKSNYDPADLKGKTVDGKPVDTRTTSEAVDGRRQEVDASNQKQAEFNEKYKQDVADGKNKTGAETKGSDAKTAAPEAKTAAPEAKTAAPEAKTAAPEAKTAAPEAKVKALDVDVPKTKVAAPDVPKINAPDVGVKTKVKAGAGKVLEVGGKAADGVDIFATAEDVKQDLTKGNIKEAAEKVGTAVVDEVTAGAFSTAKLIKERTDEKSGMQRAIRQVNTANGEIYEQKAFQKLIKEGGLSNEEAKAVLSAQREGERQDYIKLVKAGRLTQEDVDAVWKAHHTGGEGALERKMKELGIKPPELIIEPEIGPDDNWEQRSLQVQEAVKDNFKKAGKFLKETGKDLSEIGTGLAEKGVAKEVIGQSVDNTKGWLETWRTNRKADANLGEGREGMEAYLVSRGASQEAAQKAADEMYNKGNSSAVRKLDDMLEYREACKEARRRGEEPPTEEEWVETGTSRLARDARANLKENEAKTEDAAESDDGKDGKKEEGLISKLAGSKKDKDAKETESSMDLADKDRKVKEASTSGDQAAAEADQMVSEAGAEADDIKAEAARQVTQDHMENSMSKKMGDALESSITAGGAAFGSTIGAGLAQEAGKNIFEKSHKKETERLAKVEADKKAKEDAARREKETDKKPGSSGGAGQSVAQSGGQSSTDAGGAGGKRDSVGGNSSETKPTVPEIKNESISTSGSGTQTTAAVRKCIDCGTIGPIYGKYEFLGKIKNGYKCSKCGSIEIPNEANSETEPVKEVVTTPKPTSGGECVRCAAPKRNVEPLCLACTTRVMSSYSSYVTTNGREGGQDSQYFYGLSAGTKARIESVANREKEASANRKPYEGGAVDTTFP